MLEAAISTFRRIGGGGSEAWALNRYAAVISASGDPTRAEALYLEALSLARETGRSDDEAYALEGSGECQLLGGETSVAVTQLGQALAIFQRLAMHPDSDRLQIRRAGLTKPEGQPR